MKDFTPNIPEVVAEVRELFERYESALEAKDVAVLDATFWNSPHTIRYALHENGYGFEAIHKHRVARPPGPGLARPSEFRHTCVSVRSRTGTDCETRPTYVPPISRSGAGTTRGGGHRRPSRNGPGLLSTPGPTTSRRTM